MGFLFELLFELIFDGVLSAAKNEKVSMWIRVPLIVIIAAFIIGVIVAIAIFGVYVLSIREDNSQHAAGIGLLLLDALFVLSGTAKAVKHINKKRNAKKKRENI